MLQVEHIKNVETRRGSFVIFDNDFYIGHALSRYGEYSEDEPRLWAKFIKPGDTVIDAGANIGVFTVALAELVGDHGKVYAFEPQPTTYQLLLKNILGRANVDALPYALSASTGVSRIPEYWQIGIKNYGGIELVDPEIGGNFGLDVDVKTLDGMLGDIERLDFIKLDVEGMEKQALQGGAELIKRFRPVLYVENDRENKSADLIRYIKDLDYKLLWHVPRVYREDNFNKAQLEPSDRALVSPMMLCVPQERAAQFEAVTADLAPVEIKPPKPKGWACVVRLGGIGDNLIAASVLRPLKHLGYKVEVISQEPQCVIFENNPFIDKLTIKNWQRDIPQGDQMAWQKFWWARSCEYERFANLSHSVEVLMAQFPASTAFWWPAEFRRKMCGGSYLEAAHDVAGVPHEFGPLFFPTDEEREDIAALRRRIDPTGTRKLIAWCVRGTRIDKLYPYSSHAIARIIAELDADVILLSAPAPHVDVKYAEQILAQVETANSSTHGLFEARHIEGQHNWPIRRMLALAAMSDVVIGPDSGVMWAVAMEQMPKVLLHSHASVNNITAHWRNTISLHANQRLTPCSPCHLLHDYIDTCQEEQKKCGLSPQQSDNGAACISSIPVELLLNATRISLARSEADEMQRWVGRVTLQNWEFRNGD